jgi:hypothetical protein
MGTEALLNDHGHASGGVFVTANPLKNYNRAGFWQFKPRWAAGTCEKPDQNRLTGAGAERPVTIQKQKITFFLFA